MQDRVVLDINIDLEDFFTNKAIQLIDRISGNEFARWGMMNAHEMIEHLVFPLEFAINPIPAKLITPEEKLEKQRMYLHSPYGMPRNFKVVFLPPDKTVALKYPNISDSKVYLKNAIASFLEVLHAPDFTVKMHPLFGLINKQEWLLFQYKHFMHHFMQFGLV